MFAIFFRCLLGQHPRIRWNRKRRSPELKLPKFRSKFLLQQFRLSMAKHRVKREAEQSFNDADETESAVSLSNDDRKQKNKLPCEVSLIHFKKKRSRKTINIISYFTATS